MGKKLLIVDANKYRDFVKGIAESKGCYEKITFVDDDREGKMGNIDDLGRLCGEYRYAIAACDDGLKRLEWNRKLETKYNIPLLVHLDSSVPTSETLELGCIVGPGVVIGKESYIGNATIIESNTVVEPHCFIGDGCTLRTGTIVRSGSKLATGTETEPGMDFFNSLT